MRRFRFTIGGLLAVVFVSAIGVAALRSSNEGWDSAVFGLTLLTLAASLILVAQKRERARAFWLGFAIFGWVYLVASLIPPIEARLPSTKALTKLDEVRPKASDDPTAGAVVDFVQGDAFTSTAPATGSAPARLGWSLAPGQGNANLTFIATLKSTNVHFVAIGHSLLALILAFLGGNISRALAPPPKGDPS